MSTLIIVLQQCSREGQGGIVASIVNQGKGAVQASPIESLLNSFHPWTASNLSIFAWSYLKSYRTLQCQNLLTLSEYNRRSYGMPCQSDTCVVC